MVKGCSYARHHVVGVQHVPVVVGRVAPQLKRLAPRRYARCQVFAAPGVERYAIVSRSGHAVERAPVQGIRMAEVVPSAHILAHPASRLGQRGRDGERIETVLDTIVVNILQKGLLLAGEKRRLSCYLERHRGQDQKKASCHKKGGDCRMPWPSGAKVGSCHNTLTACGIIQAALGPEARVRRDRGGELVVQAGTPRPLLSITIDGRPYPAVTSSRPQRLT